MARQREWDEGGDQSFPVDFKKIFRGFLRRIWAVLLFALGGLAVGIYMSYSMLGVYDAESFLIYQQHDPRDSQYQIMHITLPSAVEMVKLPVHLKAVKSVLGLDYTIEELDAMITVELPVKESNIIPIHVEADNPTIAIDIANTLAQVVVKSAQDLSRKQWQQAYTYFSNQDRSLRDKLSRKIAELGEFRQKHRFIGMDITSSVSLQDLRMSEKQLQEISLSHSKQQVEYENIKQEYEKIPDRVPRADVDINHSAQIAQLESALILARSKYAEHNPKVKALESQLDNLKGSKEKEGTEQANLVANPIKEKLDLELIALESRLLSTKKLKEEVGEVVEELKGRVKNLSQEQLLFAQMITGKNAVEQNIEQNEVLQRNTELMINLGKGDIEMYQAAQKAFSNEDSMIVEILPALGFIVGAFVGVVFVLGLEASDKKLRTPKQCELALDLPCLATIPRMRSLTGENSELKTLFYIRSIAERLQKCQPGYKSVAITSSIEGEGKSCIAYNLGLYYAKLNKKVIVLEFDYRENPFFGGKSNPEQSLGSFLRGQASLEQVITFGSVDRIKASHDAEMKELINSPTMKELWQKLSMAYDMIVIDTPGVIDEDAANSMVSLADQCAFVINSSDVRREYVESSIKELDVCGVKISGIILNKILPIYLDNIRVRRHDRKGK